MLCYVMLLSQLCCIQILDLLREDRAQKDTTAFVLGIIMSLLFS